MDRIIDGLMHPQTSNSHFSATEPSLVRTCLELIANDILLDGLYAVLLEIGLFLSVASVLLKPMQYDLSILSILLMALVIAYQLFVLFRRDDQEIPESEESAAKVPT